MGKCTKIVVTAALVAGLIGGCCYKKYEREVQDTSIGLYEKAAAVIKMPFKCLYNFATDGKKQEQAVSVQENIEQVVQEDYQSQSNQVSSIESNSVSKANIPTNQVVNPTNQLEYFKSEYKKMNELMNSGKLEEAKEVNQKLLQEIQAYKNAE